MHIIYQQFISRDDLRHNRAAIYVFGDNEERVGLGGQAREMRGEINAHGIATLRYPGKFWTDETLEANIARINTDVLNLYLRKPGVVVFPLDGIGTGLARLRETGPKTYLHLSQTLSKMGIRNGHQ